MSMQPIGDQSMFSKIVSEIKEIQNRHMKDEEYGADYSPYFYLDKQTVIQEARVFNEPSFVKTHPKRCCHHLTKLLWFLAQGENFSKNDLTPVFFGVTKLFQNPDGNLHRMVYLFLREIAEKTDSSDIIIVIQSLVKDTSSDIPLFQGNAYRALARIIDVSMLAQIDRYYKQAIVSKDEFVAAATLSSLLTLAKKPSAIEIISRWSNEINTVLNSTKAPMVSFLALALLRTLKRNDQLAVSKVVSSLLSKSMNHGQESPLSVILLLRYALPLAASPDASESERTGFVRLLTNAAQRYVSVEPMVAYECARLALLAPASLEIPSSTVFSVVQPLLQNKTIASQYAAVKLLNKLALTNPEVVSSFSSQLEFFANPVSTDRGIATLALTALISTAPEAQVEKITKDLPGFIVELKSDALRTTIVTALNQRVSSMSSSSNSSGVSLSLARSILSFLSAALRDEAGIHFKAAVVSAIVSIVDSCPEIRADGLLHLCEFVEDCEFPQLASRVLHVLGTQAPLLAAPQPQQIVRFIYNRLILEEPVVRAAAVSALEKFATRLPELAPSILPLLERCLDDEDDEVRDRALLSLEILSSQLTQATGTKPEIKTLRDYGGEVGVLSAASARAVAQKTLPFPLEAFGRSLKLFAARPSAAPFTLASLPHVEPEAVPKSLRATVEAAIARAGGHGYESELAARAEVAGTAVSKPEAASLGAGSGTTAEAADSAAASQAVQRVLEIPEFSSFGSLIRATPPVPLTERELEYLVSAQKFIFRTHVVIGFTVTNTVPEVILERVTPRVGVDASVLKTVATLSAPSVPVDTPTTCYVALERVDESFYSSTEIQASLRFLVAECEPGSTVSLGGGTPESYPLSPVSLTPADFIVPLAGNSSVSSDFKAAWDAVSSEGEVQETFQLATMNNGVPEAVAATIAALGMQPVGGTGIVKPGVTKHVCNLSGSFFGQAVVLARMQVSLDENGLVLRIAIRSEIDFVPELLLECIG